MKKIGMLIASLVIAGAVTANAAEITCFGNDDAGTVFIAQLTDFVDNKAVGTLYVEAGANETVSLGRGTLEAAKGKVTIPDSSDWSDQLYIEGKDVHMNLKKSGRASYKGEFCGPHNNINIAGVQFVKNDCLKVECKSNRLSQIKAD